MYQVLYIGDVPVYLHKGIAPNKHKGIAPNASASTIKKPPPPTTKKPPPSRDAPKMAFCQKSGFPSHAYWGRTYTKEYTCTRSCTIVLQYSAGNLNLRNLQRPGTIPGACGSTAGLRRERHDPLLPLHALLRGRIEALSNGEPGVETSTYVPWTHPLTPHVGFRTCTCTYNVMYILLGIPSIQCHVLPYFYNRDRGRSWDPPAGLRSAHGARVSRGSQSTSRLRRGSQSRLE